MHKIEAIHGLCFSNILTAIISHPRKYSPKGTPWERQTSPWFWLHNRLISHAGAVFAVCRNSTHRVATISKLYGNSKSKCERIGLCTDRCLYTRDLNSLLWAEPCFIVVSWSEYQAIVVSFIHLVWTKSPPFCTYSTD